MTGNKTLQDNVARMESILNRIKPQSQPDDNGNKEIGAKKPSLAPKPEVKEKPMEPVPDEALNQTTVLSKFSVTGDSEKLSQTLGNETYVLSEIALAAQFTMIYAAPNTGKTLILLAGIAQAISEKRISAESVYYINADDHLRGAIEKLGIAEELGFHMLCPGHKGFENSKLYDLLKQLIASNQAKGTVILIDTIKKFVNLMDKNQSSRWSSLFREFVMQGGTVILLAHTNKNKGGDGKRVYGGTSDLVDDADAAYVIDVIQETNDTRYVECQCIKRRGSNAERAHFKYSIENEQSYDQLLASVESVDASELENIHDTKATATGGNETPIIEGIIAGINNGITTKMELVKLASSHSGQSRKKVMKVLEQYTGDDPITANWRFERRERGAMHYMLLPASSEI
jgi:hypothetical protein